MKRLFLIIPLLLSGCQIEKFNQPPAWSSAVTAHADFLGIDATIPMGTGVSVGVKLGFGRTTWSVIPCSTNRVFAAPVSDTYSYVQGIWPFNTSIREYIQAGFEPGQMPTPAMLSRPTNGIALPPKLKP